MIGLNIPTHGVCRVCWSLPASLNYVIFSNPFIDYLLIAGCNMSKLWIIPIPHIIVGQHIKSLRDALLT